eukprot:858017-Pelagomonas_calceolata.AAC.2
MRAPSCARHASVHSLVSYKRVPVCTKSWKEVQVRQAPRGAGKQDAASITIIIIIITPAADENPSPLPHLGGIQDVGVRGHLDGLVAAAQAGRSARGAEES